MTKVINGIHVLSYEEWKQIPEIEKELSKVEDCDICGGDGYHECDCGDSHKCHECFGSGKRCDFRSEYEDSLRDELEKLLAWKNGDRIRHPSNPEPHEPHSAYPAIQFNIPGN